MGATQTHKRGKNKIKCEQLLKHYCGGNNFFNMVTRDITWMHRKKRQIKQSRKFKPNPL